MTRPSAEAQITFLQQIQRLFGEGEFAATYKFALLLTLAELAVEYGDDSGDALELSMLQVGEKFAELYWRQLADYSSGQPGTLPAVLRQNYGTQAAVVPMLAGIYQRYAGRISLARLNKAEWSAAVRAVAGTVRTMPLRYLQVLGGQLEPFLYDYPCPPRVVRLKPGVTFNLRCYQSLIQQLARAGWVEHIRSNKLNAPMLGPSDDLETFMFGSARAVLSEVASVLAPLQSNQCFYCEKRIDSRAEVDHFIPWARYPRDTAHNFVLVDRVCNNDKRDMLAAQPHLERWIRRLDDYGLEMGEQLAGMGFMADMDASTHVAQWAYRQGVESGGLGWLAQGQTVPLTQGCLGAFTRG